MTGSTTKVAIVTGAGQGLGEAIALRLAQDGYDLGLVDIADGPIAKVADSVERRGVKSVVVMCDVRKKAEVDAMVEKVVSALGRVDVVVANAGIAPVGPFLDISEDVLDNLHAVNVKGVLWCYQAGACQMIKQGGGGRLIAACSTAGLRGYPGFGAYSSTKFAVRSLNQTAAIELAPHKITCNVYCPSPVDTPMWTCCDKTLSELAGVPVGSVSNQQIAKNPSGRIVRPEEVAGLVSFLAGPDSGFITGDSMLVTGGDVVQ